MRNPFKRRIPHPDAPPSGVHYLEGPHITAGAGSLVYHADRPHPLVDRFDGIVPSTQVRICEPQIVYQNISLPVQAILPGVIAGSMYTDPLTQAATFGDAVQK